MNYKETLEFLYSCLPMYQRMGEAAYKANLDNALALDEFYQHPHRSFPSVHIAGTNGKGSVSHMLSAVLQQAGYKTGLYTSPHLKDFRERIRINGKMIPEEEVVRFVAESRGIIGKVQPSFFEMTVAIAFRYFAEKNVEIAIIETGLGGRLDSTNIITPLVSVITNIGFDHMRFLGNSLEKIATEKAGIIKPNRPVIIGEYQSPSAMVFEQMALERNAPLSWAGNQYHIDYGMLSPDRKQILNVRTGEDIQYEGLVTDLTGFYQKKNIPAVLSTIDRLVKEHFIISRDDIYQGLANIRMLTGIRGRWEEIAYSPLTICDTAHNIDGVREVVQQIRQTPWKNLHMIWGMVTDKDADPILKSLPPEAGYYFTKADIPRALDEKELMVNAGLHGLKGKSFPNVQQALNAARDKAEPEDLIFIGGSSFLLAEVL